MQELIADLMVNISAGAFAGIFLQQLCIKLDAHEMLRMKIYKIRESCLLCYMMSVIEVEKKAYSTEFDGDWNDRLLFLRRLQAVRVSCVDSFRNNHTEYFLSRFTLIYDIPTTLYVLKNFASDSAILRLCTP